MCLFCKIISGEVPSSKVYEDEKVLAFLDIAPVNYGHVLVIPKEHYKNLEGVPDELLCYIMKIVKKVGKSLIDGLKVEGYNVQLNNNEVAGQVVPHIHFHLVPRKTGDMLNLWPGGKYGDGEVEEVLAKISIT